MMENGFTLHKQNDFIMSKLLNKNLKALIKVMFVLAIAKPRYDYFKINILTQSKNVVYLFITKLPKRNK